MAAVAGTTTTGSRKPAAAAPQPCALQPIRDAERDRINARVAELRMLGKPAVQKLGEELGVNCSYSQNLTVLIHAIAQKEREEQEVHHQGKGG